MPSFLLTSLERIGLLKISYTGCPMSRSENGQSRIRRANAPEHFGVFKHVAINALGNEKTCGKKIQTKWFKATLQLFLHTNSAR